MRIRQTDVIFRLRDKLESRIDLLEYSREKYDLNHVDSQLFSDAGIQFNNYCYTDGLTVNEVKEVIKDINYLLFVNRGFSTEKLSKPQNFTLLKKLLLIDLEQLNKLIKLHKKRTEYNKSIRQFSRKNIKNIGIFLVQLENEEFLLKLPDEAPYKDFSYLEKEPLLDIPTVNKNE